MPLQQGEHLTAAPPQCGEQVGGAEFAVPVALVAGRQAQEADAVGGGRAEGVGLVGRQAPDPAMLDVERSGPGAGLVGGGGAAELEHLATHRQGESVWRK